MTQFCLNLIMNALYLILILFINPKLEKKNTKNYFKKIYTRCNIVFFPIL